MSAYNPPIEDLPIFDTNAFTNANTGNGALISEYLQFPYAQGKEYFPSGLVGDLSGNATNITITSDNSTGTYYIPFTKTSGTGSKTLFMDNATTPLTYNPNTSTLTTTNLTGISSQLLLATKNDSVEYNIPFTSASAGGGGDFFIDGGLNLKYNPSTNNLTIPNMIVSNNLQNNFLSAIVGGGDFFIDGDINGGDIVITAKTSTSKTIIQTEGIGGVLTNCAIFENGGITGNLNGNASNASAITITSDNSTGNYFIPFTKTSGTGSRTLFMDDTLPALTYSPNNNLLTVRNIEATTLTASNDFDMIISTTTGTKKIYFNNTGTTGNICYMDSGGIQMASGKYLTGYVIGNLTGISSQLLLATKDDNIEYNIPFTSAVASGGSDFFIDGGLNLKYNPSTDNLTTTSMIVSYNLQNSYLSAIVGGGNFYIDGDINGADIVITAKTSTSKTIIQTEGIGGVITNCAIFENGGITGNLNGNATNLTMTTDNTAGTYFIPFTKTSGTGSKSVFIDDTTTPLTYNPSTSTLTATNFSGTCSNLTMTTDNTAGTYYIPFTKTSGTGSKSVFIDDITGPLTYNPSTSTLTATNFSGTSSNLTMTTDNTAGTYYIPFTKTSGTGSKSVFIDDTTTPLTYNPSTSTLTCSTFVGNLTGTSSNASAITITSDNSNGAYFIPFTKTIGTGSRTLFMDDVAINLPLTYNPSLSTLTCSTFVGNLTGSISGGVSGAILYQVGVDTSAFTTAGTSGQSLLSAGGGTPTWGIPATASSASTASTITLTTDNTSGNYFLTFSKFNAGTSKSLFIDDTTTPLTYNPSTSSLTCSTFVGNLTGSASKVGVLSSVDNINYDMIFTDTNGNIYKDGENNIRYNPYTNILSGMILNGDLTGNLTGTASNLQITTTITSSDYNIPFTNQGGTGSSSLYIDGGLNLKYNPSTDTLSVPTLNAGNLTASDALNIKSGTTANSVYISNGATLSLSVSTTEIKARSGAIFVGDLSGNSVSSTTSTTATNIAGGTQNAIPIQTASGATSFITGFNTGSKPLGMCLSIGNIGTVSYNYNFGSILGFNLYTGNRTMYPPDDCNRINIFSGHTGNLLVDFSTDVLGPYAPSNGDVMTIINKSSTGTITVRLGLNTIRVLPAAGNIYNTTGATFIYTTTGGYWVCIN